MRRSTSDRPFASPGDRAKCRDTIRGGSKSFFTASLVLPKRVREPAYALYAFCRTADDAADTGADRVAALDRLADRLDAVYRERPLNHPVDRAFADVVRDYAIPRALPEGLLEGLRWDQTERVYERLDDVLDYAARVAAAVGAMMTLLMGVRDKTVLARACDLGAAMQLTNIARDVGEDAREGRLYLPRDWMRAAGLEPEAFLAEPVFSDAIGEVVKRLLDEATRLYGRARPGITQLPYDCRLGIHAAALLYQEIGAEIARNGYDSVTTRAFTGPARKLALLARARSEASRRIEAEPKPALPANQFLVDAVEAAEQARATAPDGLFPALEERVSWVLDLMVDLDAREKARRWPVSV